MLLRNCSSEAVRQMQQANGNGQPCVPWDTDSVLNQGFPGSQENKILEYSVTQRNAHGYSIKLKRKQMGLGGKMPSKREFKFPPPK